MNWLVDAEKLFYAATRQDTLFCDAWDHLSISCRRQGHYKDDFFAGINSLIIDSTNVVAWTNCGYAALLNGSMDDAITSFEHLQRIIPDNPEGYYGLSMVLYSINEIKNARDNILLAKQKYKLGNIQIGSEVDLLHGFIEYKYGDLESAQQLFEKVYPKFKKNADLNYFLGDCIMVNEKNPKKAKSYKDKAIRFGYKEEDAEIPIN
jgi:tetratricopeptide (TPR) repeat protein